jgi:hypothetical protein
MSKKTHKNHGLDKPELESCYAQGMTETEIGIKYGVSQPAIAYYRKKWGLASPTYRDRIGASSGRHIDAISAQEFSRLYQTYGERAMGEMFGCSKMLIRTKRTELGIKPLSKNKRNVISAPDDMTEKQFGVVVGSLLGDACVRNRFSEGHCEKQLGYVEWKAHILSPYGAYIGPRNKTLEDGRVSAGFSITTKTHPIWDGFNNRWYGSSGKRVCMGDVYAAKGVLPAVVWYLDDGFLRGDNYCIGTAFEDREVEALIRWIQSLGIAARREGERHKKIVNIIIDHSVGKYICEYAPECMRYKIRPIDRFKYALCGADLSVKSRVESFRCSEWADFSDNDKNALISDAALYWRTMGFPKFELSRARYEASIRGLKEKSCVFRDGRIEAPKGDYGDSVLKKHFPDMRNAKKYGKKSPQEVFESDILAKAIRKVIEKSKSSKISPNALRSELFTYGGVTNFRPILAKSLIQRFGSRKILDPCCGYGGRLLGAMASDADEYTGYDANGHTVMQLRRLAKIAGRRFDNKTKVTIRYGAFEESEPENDFDMVCTSPPYWRKEWYSNDECQAYTNYDTYKAFFDGFMKAMIRKSFNSMRAGGVFILNVSDFTVDRTTYMFERDSINETRSVFGNVTVWRYVMPKIFSSGTKSEPVVIAHKK